MSKHQQSLGGAGLSSHTRGRFGDRGWTRARAVLSLGMVAGLGAVGTFAAWSDTATATTGVFSTAATMKTVEMAIDGNRTATTVTKLKADNLMPRSSTAATLVVNNVGTADFTYTAKATADGGAIWAQALTVTAYPGDLDSNGKCGGAPLGSTALEAGAARTLIGNGQALAAGGNATICLKVDVGDNVYKAASGKSATTSIEFTATES